VNMSTDQNTFHEIIKNLTFSIMFLLNP
jgi:hypothetical protein